jgi:hypothetical protein
MAHWIFLSEPAGIIECMFDESSAVLVERIAAAARAENQAAGQRLAVIGELDVMRLREVGERETWCTDTQEAVTAEVAAALTITQALAASYLYYSRDAVAAAASRGAVGGPGTSTIECCHSSKAVR